MAAQVVVDSGIVLATVLEEPYSEKAEALVGLWRKQGVQLAAPVLFRYEVVAVLRRSLYQGRLTVEEALAGRDMLLTLPVQFHIDDMLLKRAYELAIQCNRPTAYDSQYLAVAERLGCEFWTADQKLFHAIRSMVSWIRWVGDFTG